MDFLSACCSSSSPRICGLPAILGASLCADDIIRMGFPLQFLEEGGFAYRHNFNSLHLLVDVLIGFGFAWLVGGITHRDARKTQKLS